jgi:UDP-N-acetylglucosamine 2-epimerase
VLQAVELAMAQPPLGRGDASVPDYGERDVSRKVVRIILSYVDYVQRTIWFRPSE